MIATISRQLSLEDTADKDGPPFDIRNDKTKTTLRHLKTYYYENSEYVGVVYEDEKTGQIYAAIKGSADFDHSKLSHIMVRHDDANTSSRQRSQADNDWETNRKQQIPPALTSPPSESLPEQYRDAELFLMEVMKNFPGKQIFLSAHSKGGGQLQYAMMACRHYIEKNNVQIKAFAFDPPPLNLGQEDLKARGLMANVPYAQAVNERAFADKHIEIFQVATNDGRLEMLSDVQLSADTINSSLSGNFFGNINQLFVPSASRCTNRQLHGMDIAILALRNEIDSPDNWVVDAVPNPFYQNMQRHGVFGVGGDPNYNPDNKFVMLSRPDNVQLQFTKEATDELNQRCAEGMPLSPNVSPNRLGVWRASKAGLANEVFKSTSTLPKLR